MRKYHLNLIAAFLVLSLGGVLNAQILEKVFESKDHVAIFKNEFPNVSITINKKSGELVKKITRMDIINDGKASKDTLIEVTKDPVREFQFLAFDDDLEKAAYIAFAVRINDGRHPDYTIYTWGFHAPDNSLISWDSFEASRVDGGGFTPDGNFIFYDIISDNNIFSPLLQFIRIQSIIDQEDVEDGTAYQFPEEHDAEKSEGVLNCEILDYSFEKSSNNHEILKLKKKFSETIFDWEGGRLPDPAFEEIHEVVFDLTDGKYLVGPFHPVSLAGKKIAETQLKKYKMVTKKNKARLKVKKALGIPGKTPISPMKSPKPSHPRSRM